ncbi:LacI family DNA-binding transcriptional regulator [Streptomyces sp. NBS 14/10]|uniref:LacI family DNA-binding transcriptional regulator n=1 Tax=Streptomyces sp. NBS 14/10 TaxID=1945643 RepID=UPI000B7EAAD6|nr:LacI family DNA-binding transcriptional regulator [Streptomyces sp. NBS 14/10]KAK1176857.1 LacI family DNA-binding transcriptional regulator [Streptomyces sp. NBS 14/10]NUS87048.1 LacI family transcriptional regulator [Streptomyces sp.]
MCTAPDTSGAPTVTIRDVAREAGVSHQTVSRVINGHSAVADATRHRVEAAIDSLGFRPNHAARELAGKAARSLTVLTSDTSLYGAASTLRGIEEAARAASFAVAVSVLDRHAHPDRAELRARLARPGEPVVVIAFDAPGVHALRLLPADTPVVAAVERPSGREPVSARPQAWLDDRLAAAHATRHLLGLGHRTVHYLALPSSTADVAQRTQGWLDALRAAGAPEPPVLEGGWTPRTGYLAARELVADRSVTAVLCGNDDVAAGVMRAAREAGRHIPDDLSVAGFDDVPVAAFLAPALTTVRLDFEGLGRTCFSLLRRLLDPAAPAPDPCDEPALIVRESTGPWRGTGE